MGFQFFCYTILEIDLLLDFKDKYIDIQTYGDSSRQSRHNNDTDDYYHNDIDDDDDYYKNNNNNKFVNQKGIQPESRREKQN